MKKANRKGWMIILAVLVVLLAAALCLTLGRKNTRASALRISETGLLADIPWDTPMEDLEKLLPGGILRGKGEAASTYCLNVEAPFEGIQHGLRTRVQLTSYNFFETPYFIRIELFTKDEADRDAAFEELTAIYTQRLGEPRTPNKVSRVWNTPESKIKLHHSAVDESTLDIWIRPMDPEKMQVLLEF